MNNGENPNWCQHLSDYDKEYFEWSQDAILYGKERILKGIKYIRYNGRQAPLARILWNNYFPEDPVLQTDLVIHINGDKTDFDLDNLIKIDRHDFLNPYEWCINSLIGASSYEYERILW